MARWDPLHQYWTTNSVLGVDVNMGGWGERSEGVGRSEGADWRSEGGGGRSEGVGGDSDGVRVGVGAPW